MLEQSKSINLLQTSFYSFILRLIHQVYEKMLNYINQKVYLRKMAPLKWGVGEFGVYVVFGVCGGFMEIVEGGMGKGNTHPHGIYLPTEVVCASHFIVWCSYGGRVLIDLMKQPQYGGCKSLSVIN